MSSSLVSEVEQEAKNFLRENVETLFHYIVDKLPHRSELEQLALHDLVSNLDRDPATVSLSGGPSETPGLPNAGLAQEVLDLKAQVAALVDALNKQGVNAAAEAPAVSVATPPVDAPAVSVVTPPAEAPAAPVAPSVADILAPPSGS